MSRSSEQTFVALRRVVAKASKDRVGSVAIRVTEMEALLREYDEACSRAAATLREMTRPLPDFGEA